MTLTAKTGMNRNRRAVLSPWSYPGPGLPQPEHIGLFRLNGLISTSMQSPFLADTRWTRVYVHPWIGWYRLSNVSMCMTRHLPFYSYGRISWPTPRHARIIWTYTLRLGATRISGL